MLDLLVYDFCQCTLDGMYFEANAVTTVVV